MKGVTALGPRDSSVVTAAPEIFRETGGPCLRGCGLYQPGRLIGGEGRPTGQDGRSAGLEARPLWGSVPPSQLSCLCGLFPSLPQAGSRPEGDLQPRGIPGLWPPVWAGRAQSAMVDQTCSPFPVPHVTALVALESEVSCLLQWTKRHARFLRKPECGRHFAWPRL